MYSSSLPRNLSSFQEKQSVLSKETDKIREKMLQDMTLRDMDMGLKGVSMSTYFYRHQALNLSSHRMVIDKTPYPFVDISGASHLRCLCCHPGNIFDFDVRRCHLQTAVSPKSSLHDRINRSPVITPVVASSSSSSEESGITGEYRFTARNYRPFSSIVLSFNLNCKPDLFLSNKVSQSDKKSNE